MCRPTAEPSGRSRRDREIKGVEPLKGIIAQSEESMMKRGDDPLSTKPLCPTDTQARAKPHVRYIGFQSIDAERRLLRRPLSICCMKGRADNSFVRFGDEPIAEPSYRHQMTWLRRDCFKVLSETHDEIVDRAGVCVFPKAPYFFEQRSARHDFPLVPDQVAEDLVFHQRLPDGARA